MQEDGSDVVRVLTKGAPDFLLNWDQARADEALGGKTEDDEPPVDHMLMGDGSVM